MRVNLTPKIVLLSAFYFIISVVILLIVDLGLFWFLNNVAFNIFDWFNRINIFWKIFILFIGGWALFSYLLTFTSRITTLIGGLIFDRLPHNLFTSLSTTVLSIANIIFCIVILWRVPEHYSFWIVCELIIMSSFIWSLGLIVLPAKEQLQIFGNRNRY